MAVKTGLSQLLRSVSKEYRCDICGETYLTHEEAVKCADTCLSQKKQPTKVVQ